MRWMNSCSLVSQYIEVAFIGNKLVGKLYSLIQLKKYPFGTFTSPPLGQVIYTQVFHKKFGVQTLSSGYTIDGGSTAGGALDLSFF